MTFYFKPKPMKNLIYGTLAVLAITAIYGYYQYQKLMAYKFEIKNYNLRGFTKDNIKFSFNYVIENISKLSFDILSVDLQVYLNGKHLGYIKNTIAVNAPSEGKASIPLTLDINPQKAFKPAELITLAAHYAADRSKLVFHFAGKIKARKLITFDIPIDFTMTLKEMIEA